MDYCFQTSAWVELSKGKLYTNTWPPTHETPQVSIILFHDSLGCVALWKDFPEKLALATGYRVIAYDRMGFGQSDARQDSLSKEFIREEAIEVLPVLIDRLSIGAFVACGHSVGGAMAIEAGAANPDLCKGVVTVSAQAFVEQRTLKGIRQARDIFTAADNRARLFKYHGDKTPWVLSAWIDTWLAPEFAEWNLDVPLGKIKASILAIHGDRDEYGSLEHPKRIAGKNGTCEILHGIGHNPHRETVEALVETIREWISKSDAEHRPYRPNPI